jgi:alanyl aminopeptidase
MRIAIATLSALSLTLLACATAQEAPERSAEPAVPLGQLPEGVTPLRYALDLDIDPRLETFSGAVQIVVQVDEPADHLWLHGENLEVVQAEVEHQGERLAAAWSIEGEPGVAKLQLPAQVKGEVTLHLAYKAPFDENLKGLYRVEEGGESYAFTQFESHFARLAFPCFDEPRFKTRFDIAVTVKKGDVAITATAEQSREDKGDKTRITYSTTEPLPTYLIAFAVGPLDVVEGKIGKNDVRGFPLPFRGVAAKGKGPQLKYALENTGPILAELERYFGMAHPYEKLDIIAVPDFASGAMENVGAITFREWLLLVDEESAPVSQKQAFAYVMAHELAHQWFGNLVTMPWWDDIWLNEAFATWMGFRVVENVHPDFAADVSFLERVHGAMVSDSLVNARQIRNPVESSHDIRNAFDSITYSKGGGVLSMFETWLGKDVFRAGLQQYMETHRFGSATYEDLLAAFSEASGKDVATPFKTFLFQPGVPLVEAELVCGEKGDQGRSAELKLKQSRYLPVGSKGSRDQLWQIPVCASWSVGGEPQKPACTMLTEQTGAIDLGATCPDFVMPNAGGASYYRWAMPGADLDKLLGAGKKLSAKERISVAEAVRAAFDAAALDAGEVLPRLSAMAKDPHRAVNTAPMRILGFARDHLVDEKSRARVDAFGQKLYRPWVEKLGYQAGKDDSPDTRKQRASILGFMALAVEDAAVRSELAKRGRAYVGFGGDGKIHADAVDPDLAGVALAAAVRDGDAKLFDHLEQLFSGSDNALIRGQILGAFGQTRDPALTARARALTLDDRVRGNEVFRPLSALLAEPDTRAPTWSWLKTNYDALLEKMPSTRTGRVPGIAAYFCDEAGINEASTFFKDKAEALVGGPRNLKLGLERASLCAARVEAHKVSAQAFFAAEAAMKDFRSLPWQGVERPVRLARD